MGLGKIFHPIRAEDPPQVDRSSLERDGRGGLVAAARLPLGFRSLSDPGNYIFFLRGDEVARMWSLVGRVTVVGGRSGEAMRSFSSVPAVRPSSYVGWATVVRLGTTRSAQGMSSKPTIAMSSGARSPLRVRHSRAPTVIRLLAANKASGGSGSSTRLSIAAYPPASRKSAYRTKSLS